MLQPEDVFTFNCEFDSAGSTIVSLLPSPGSTAFASL